MQCFGEITLQDLKKVSKTLAFNTGMATTIRLDPWPARSASIRGVPTLDHPTGEAAGVELARAVFVQREDLDL